MKKLGEVNLIEFNNNELEIDEIAFIEVTKLLDKLNINGIIIGAESIILDTKTRLVTTDIDYLLFEDDFSKLLNELKDKEELKISNVAVINSIEVDTFGWLSSDCSINCLKSLFLTKYPKQITESM